MKAPEFASENPDNRTAFYKITQILYKHKHRGVCVNVQTYILEMYKFQYKERKSTTKNDREMKEIVFLRFLKIFFSGISIELKFIRHRKF